MTKLAKTLEIRTSPHVLSGYSVDTIMFNVVLALVPTAAFGVYVFGWTAALTILVGIASCNVAEHVMCHVNRRESTVGDWSATITGLLYALTLPPHLPLWMNAVGGFVAIVLGKTLFGGLGNNPFNPALIGRALLQAAFPVAMTTWLPALSPGRFTSLPPSLLAPPFTRPLYDAVSGATPLAAWKFGNQLTDTRELALGLVSGSTGETCAALILLGGLYLAARNMMNWRISVGMLASTAALSGAMHAANPSTYPSAPFMLFSGGLMLGAVFMATDMVASPMTNTGCWIYGAAIGLLVVVIRVWGGMPEGVMYAILMGNALSPQIDRAFRPRVFGTAARRVAR